MNHIIFRSTTHKEKTNSHFMAVLLIYLLYVSNGLSGNNQRGLGVQVKHSQHWSVTGVVFAGGSPHEAGLQMMIRANDRRPSGRLIGRPFFYVTWLRGMRPLTRPCRGSREPLFLAFQGTKRTCLSVSSVLFSSATCALRTGTPASVETRVCPWCGCSTAVFVCCYMAEVDQMISPAMAHRACTS